MICIAAFIILCLLSVVVAFLSIFKRDLWKKYVKVFKKSWSCFGKRVTFQKCETSFGDDVKNSLLSRLALKNPKLIKPASIGLEALSIIIVFIAAWSVVEAGKAGLALWTLGTCNVKQPSSCALGATACNIDEVSGDKSFFESVGSWFTDWGEIFGAIPDKFRSWDVEQFDFSYLELGTGEEQAIDIMDPLCIVCAESFKKQIDSGFFENYRVRLVPFPIRASDTAYKFNNSDLIVSYIFATDRQENPEKFEARNELIATPALEIIYRIYVEKNDSGQSYQDYFNYSADVEQTEDLLQDWLREFGFADEEIREIADFTQSDEMQDILNKNNSIVIDDIHAKAIPTMIYGGRKHNGGFEG